MKRTLSFLALLGLLLVVSCFEPPQYSIIPSIEFENVRTKDVADPNVSDTLIVTVSFKDGDGDLGRNRDTENDPPFNQKWYFRLNPVASCEATVTPPCKKISYKDMGNLGDYVKYSTRRTNPNYDTLPPYTKPFNCKNYEILTNGGQIVDTLYFQYNPREYNFLCDLYVVEAGVPKKYDWYAGASCPAPREPLYGIFDILASDGNPDLGLPLEGTIAFKIASNSMSGLKNKVLQFKIRIVDRAGNYSNEVISDNFPFD
jgi:hypothetical protein